MKNLLYSALLALGTAAVVSPPSFAGAFGLFTCCHSCCDKCCFCIRQYNAFTPICCGPITLMGPNMGPGGGPCGPSGGPVCLDGSGDTPAANLNLIGLPAFGCGHGCCAYGQPVTDGSVSNPAPQMMAQTPAAPAWGYANLGYGYPVAPVNPAAYGVQPASYQQPSYGYGYGYGYGATAPGYGYGYTGYNGYGYPMNQGGYAPAWWGMGGY